MNNNERREHLWKALEQLRATGISFSGAQSVAAALIEQGEELTWRDYDLLLQQLGLFGHGSKNFNPHYKPTNQITLETIRHFLSETLKSGTIDTVFDPWNSGLPLMHALVDTGVASKGSGLTPNLDTAELLSNLAQTMPIDWHCSSYLDAPETVNQKADLLICFPPWNVRSKHSWTDPTDGTVITDEDAHILLMNMGAHLIENELAIFALPDSFFFRHSKMPVREHLYRAGLNIESVINVPNMSASLGTSLPFNLVFARKTSNVGDHYFVGQLSASAERNTVLAKNLVSRTRGESSELGKLISKAEFRGYASVQAEERLAKLSAPYQKYPQVALSDIAPDINVGKQKPDFEFEHQPNSVYVPMHPNGQAVADPTGVRNAKNYLQVNVDPEKAHPQYVANYLNTELGRQSRKMLSGGAALPRLSKTSAGKLSIFLPTIEEQENLAEADLSIQSLISELAQLQRQLTEQPRALPTIQTKLATYSNPQANEEKFTDWLEMLPFPLASILWTYHTTERYKDKYEHLLHFFEASAQFMATLMLSAVGRDQVFEAEILSSIRKSFTSEGHSLDYAAFGTWKAIHSSIAKAARKRWHGENEDAKLNCIQMFATDRARTFEFVTSKKLVLIFEKANVVRNRKKAHTGIVSEIEAAKIHEELWLLLQDYKIITSDSWLKYELIKGGLMSFNKGVYCSTGTQRVMGARTPFEKIQVETNHPLESDVLYLFDRSQNQALPLLPLVRLSSSPSTSQNACYFYNGKEKGGEIRFVSYHFKEKAEEVDVFQDTQDALSVIGL